MNLAKLTVFMDRMNRLGIKVELICNYPWIYIFSVNGNIVKPEDYFVGNHGYTIGFYPLKDELEFEFLDITRTINIIRKYR